MLNRRLLAIIAAVTALSAVLIVVPAFGGMVKPVRLQTWPSRTPTSGPRPPSGGGGGSGEPATSTPLPPSSGQEGTAIAATTTALAATQSGSSPFPSVTVLPDSAFLATAEPCALPPTALAVEAVTVHSGPGDEYEVVGRLRLLAVRPVIGRSARVPWWLVALDNGQTGWIPNRSVIIHGYTGAVDIVEAPAASAQVADGAQLWNPTPNPVCPTPLPVTEAEGGGVSGGSQDTTAGAETAADGDASTAAASGRESSASTAESSGSSASGSQTGNQGPADAGASDSSESAAAGGASLTGDGSEENRGSLTWVLVIGIVMILGGAIALLVQAGASRSGSSN